MDSYEELAGRLASLEARVAALEGSATAERPHLASSHSDDGDAAEVIRVQVSNLRLDRTHPQDHVWFDCAFTPVGLSRPTRAAKGAFEFCDLFGEPRFVIGYVLNDELRPNEPASVQGIGFEFNQFMAEHQWVVGTTLDDMVIRFRVDQILYADGGRS